MLALTKVDFELLEGEIHGLVGENGAGKSTLIKVIAGAHPADSGQILAKGHEAKIHSPADARHYGISVVHQHANLVPQLSIAENIYLGQEPAKGKSGFVDWKPMHDRARELCKQVGLDCDVTQPVFSLSFVEQQLVAIARALLSRNMHVLVLDEPTASMDIAGKDRLLDVLRSLKGQGISIIYVSHRLDEVCEITDRVTILRDGSRVDTVQTSEVDANEIVRMMLGKSLEQQFPERDGKAGDIILSVKELTRRPSFSNVSFDVRKGEILGIFGVVGSGKSELLHAIYGADAYESGQVIFDGAPTIANTPRKAISNGLFLVPEDRHQQGLVLDLSIKENLLLANLDRCTTSWSFIKNGQERNDAQSLVEDLRIKCKNAVEKVVFLSGGNQQKVVLGKGLYTQASLYMFDEPTRGVDVGAKAEIYRLMRNLAKQGVGVIVASSESAEIMGICDRIAVMRQGKLVQIIQREQATEELILSAALAGKAS